MTAVPQRRCDAFCLSKMPRLRRSHDALFSDTAAYRGVLQLLSPRQTSKSGRLPDVHAFVCWADHGRSVRNVERLLEFRHVRERAIHAELRRGMRVGSEPQLLIFIANF